MTRGLPHQVDTVIVGVSTAVYLEPNPDTDSFQAVVHLP